MKLPLERATVTLPAPDQIRIERRFQAPAALVWKAWTTPELVARWWSDATMPVTSVEIDLRVGGAWRYAIAGPGGHPLVWRGTFLELEPERRIVSTEVFEGAAEAESTNTLTLTEAADGTTLLSVLVQHGSAAHRDGHLASGMEPGLQRALDRLEGVLHTVASPPRVATCLWFRDQAEAAARFYVSLVPGSELGSVVSMAPEGPVTMVTFTLGGVPFQALNGATADFSDTASISVSTRTAEETDRLWAALTADGGREGRCGWCTDRFGVAWQVVPTRLPELLGHPDREAAGRALQAMLQMSKLDIAGMEAAARGD